MTNSTWNDLWLNEGFTTYVEHRIMEELRGRAYADVLWYMLRQDIDRVIAEHGKGPQTRIAHSYGRETAVEDIPRGVVYEKGALFLRTLEEAYGRDAFDAWLRGWFDRHAFAPVDSRTFLAEAKSLGTKVDLSAWLYQGGLPDGAAATESERATAIEQLAANQGDIDSSAWSTLEWVVYLRALPADVTAERLKALDARHQLTASPNNEIAMHWLPLLVRVDARDAAPAVEAFLAKVGRLRMIRPLYKAMMAGTPFWRELAKTTFERAKPRYHPITRESIGGMLK